MRTNSTREHYLSQAVKYLFLLPVLLCASAAVAQPIPASYFFERLIAERAKLAQARSETIKQGNLLIQQWAKIKSAGINPQETNPAGLGLTEMQRQQLKQFNDAVAAFQNAQLNLNIAEQAVAETPAVKDVMLSSVSLPASLPVMQYTGPGGFKAAPAIAVGLGYTFGWGRARYVGPIADTSTPADGGSKVVAPKQEKTEAQYDANWWVGAGAQYAYTATSGSDQSRFLLAVWGGTQMIGITAGVAPGKPWIWVFGVITKADFFQWLPLTQDYSKK